MNTIAKRLKLFMDFKNLNSSSLASQLGYGSSEKIGRLFRDSKGNANPSAEILQDISNKFEELNVLWLLTGKQQMLLPEKEKSAEETSADQKDIDLTEIVKSYYTSLKDFQGEQKLIALRLERMEIDLLRIADQISGTATAPSSDTDKDNTVDEAPHSKRRTRNTR